MQRSVVESSNFTCQKCYLSFYSKRIFLKSASLGLGNVHLEGAPYLDAGHGRTLRTQKNVLESPLTGLQ